MYFDMMKAKAGLANALIITNDNHRAKYNIYHKTLQLAKYTVCGGKVDSKQERPELHHNNELTCGSGPTPNRRGPNPPSPATSNWRAGANHIQHTICNKARKIILEQGYCTDIYDKKGVLIYNNDNIYINNHTGDITTKTPSSGGAGQPRVWLTTKKQGENTTQEFQVGHNPAETESTVIAKPRNTNRGLRSDFAVLNRKLKRSLKRQISRKSNRQLLRGQPLWNQRAAKTEKKKKKKKTIITT